VKRTDQWRPTPAHVRSVLAGLLLTVTAVLARRPDLLVIATPFVGSAVWAVLMRPTQSPVVQQSIGHHTVREGQATTWHIDVTDPEGRIDDVAAVLDTPPWVDRRPLDGQTALSLRDDRSESLAMVVRPSRWGCHEVGPALVVASSALGSFRWASRPWVQRQRLVALPRPSPFDAAAPPVHVPGLVGVNRSPRYGSGTEFASIRPFRWGDRLKRIHWGQSLRTGELHVTTTWADNDRHIVLMIDAFNEVGQSGGIEGRASSLDISVRAAAAIAEHFTRVGDRVALTMIGARGAQRVPPGAGFRHLRRLLEVLASAEPANAELDDGRLPTGLPPGALVVMLSPLTSPRSLQRATRMADRGLSVIVIDCLPPDITDEQSGDPYVALAWRAEVLKRERQIRIAREAGIAVVPWRGPGSLDLVLRGLQRRFGSGVGRSR
jgi:uncharacterized protein (DUF58 family)